MYHRFSFIYIPSINNIMVSIVTNLCLVADQYVRQSEGWFSPQPRDVSSWMGGVVATSTEECALVCHQMSVERCHKFLFEYDMNGTCYWYN